MTLEPKFFDEMRKIAETETRKIEAKESFGGCMSCSYSRMLMICDHVEQCDLAAAFAFLALAILSEQLIPTNQFWWNESRRARGLPPYGSG